MNEPLSLNPRRFENLFDEFVRTQTDGHRLDERTDLGPTSGLKCADYFFPESKIIVELKTLNEDHSDLELIVRLAREAASRLKISESTINAWLRGQAELPAAVVAIVDSKVQNSLKKMVRKANDQIKSTRSILGKRYDGLLIVANLGERLFGPIEMLRNIAGHALGRTTLSIDAILLVTTGVTYSTAGSKPQHYVAPVYADDKEYLGDFVESLASRWIKFEANAFGASPQVEIVREFDQSMLLARPLR